MRFQDFVAIVCQTLAKQDLPIESVLSEKESDMLLADCFEAGWSTEETIDKIAADARGEWLFNDFWRD